MTDLTTTSTARLGRAGAPFRAGARLVRNPRITGTLLAGAAIMLFVIAFSVIGPHFIARSAYEVGAYMPNLHPSAANWFGTDAQGRDLFSIIVVGTPKTLQIGLIAGIVGIGIGLVLGLLSGYFGGVLDGGIRTLTDALMTVPAIAILVVIASNVGHMTVGLMGITVAMLAWMVPARTIRAQVLTIRERAYIEVARANGVGEVEILFREVMPNLIPYIAASFVYSVSAAILAAVGLEALGLGASSEQTLGMTIYWANKYSAVLLGQWWWWGPPIAVIAIIFVGLYLLSVGLDRFANPKLGPRT